MVLPIPFWAFPILCTGTDPLTHRQGGFPPECSRRTEMLDLKKDEIEGLSPAQAEELVAQLCVAEIEERGGSPQMVRHGSHTNAPDEGVDIEIDAGQCSHVGGFIPRPWTGIQVKSGKKKHEIVQALMNDEGLLPRVQEIISGGGCFMVVSLGTDMTPTEVRRIEAKMRQAVSRPDDRNAVRLLGKTEVTDWVNAHDSVNLWVRKELGRERYGWRKFGKWSINGGNVKDTLITDPGVRISFAPHPDRDFGIEAGITKLRDLVRNSNRSVRVLGHAGIGKTRIAQALFEDDSVPDALAQSKVVYGNCRMGLRPSPTEMLEDLLAKGREMFFVLDDCPPETHGVLSRMVRHEDCRVRLITIEYDVRDDAPEQTDVVRIQAWDTQAASELLMRRFPDIRPESSRHIAKLAKGNARLALALAEKAAKGENTAELSDRDFFDRLFVQRGGVDVDLRKGAEALSLVYSFVNDLGDGSSDLSVLGGLVGQTAAQMYSHGQTLSEKQLAEDIGDRWAILPQAIANKLASDALSHIPLKHIVDAFDPTTVPDLFLSFAQRISHLHRNDRAIEVAKSWLSDGAILSNLDMPTSENAMVIRYAAALVPDLVLRKVEEWVAKGRHVDADPVVAHRTAEALIEISPARHLFERCVRVLADLARQENEQRVFPVVHGYPFMLFSFRFRWIPVTIEQRFSIIRKHLESRVPADRRDGAGMLAQAFLNSSLFHYFPEYGAGPHIQGDSPEKDMDEAGWCVRHLELISRPVPQFPARAAEPIKQVLVGVFGSLWGKEEVRGALLQAMEDLGTTGPWIDGWIAALQTRWLRPADDPASGVGHPLPASLVEKLRPTDPAARVYAGILSLPPSTRFNSDFWLAPKPGGTEEEMDLSARLALGLGRRTAGMSPADRRKILSGMIEEQNEHIYLFGRGVAQRHDDLISLWRELTGALDMATDEPIRFPDVFLGVIDEAKRRDADLARQILDDAVSHQKLRGVFVRLQQRVGLDSRAVERLEACLNDPATDITDYEIIAWAESFVDIPEETLVRLLRQIATRPRGSQVVVAGLASRFMTQPQLPVGSSVVRLGMQIVQQALEDSRDTWSMPGFVARSLCEVVEVCSAHEISQPDLPHVLKALVLEFRVLFGWREKASDVIRMLTKKIPHEALDIFLAHPEDTSTAKQFLVTSRNYERSALDRVETDELVSWANLGDREARLRLIARVIWPVEVFGDDKELRLTPTATELIGLAQDPTEIALEFARSLSVMPARGDSETAISKRIAAFERIAEQPDTPLREAAEAAIVFLRDFAKRHSQEQRDWQTRSAQSFEWT